VVLGGGDEWKMSAREFLEVREILEVLEAVDVAGVVLEAAGESGG
jgi:hypothetical protein